MFSDEAIPAVSENWAPELVERVVVVPLVLLENGACIEDHGSTRASVLAVPFTGDPDFFELDPRPRRSRSDPECMAGPFGRVTEDALHLEFTNTPGPSPGDHVVETRLAPVRNHVHSLRSALERAQADTIRTTPAGELNEHILSVIRATGRATARAPRTHAGWGEKDRRQTVLKLAASTAELDEEQQRHPAGRRTAACSDWRLEGSGCAPKLLGRRALALQARRAQRLDWARRVGDPSSTSLTCLRIPMRLSKHLVRYCVSRRVLDPGPCKQCAASATAAAIDQQRPSHKLAPDCRFARPDVPELTIELPRKEAPGARRRPRPVGSDHPGRIGRTIGFVPSPSAELAIQLGTCGSPGHRSRRHRFCTTAIRRLGVGLRDPDGDPPIAFVLGAIGDR